MEKIWINDAWMEYRETPWDRQSFGVQTKEIMAVEYSNEEDLAMLVEEFEKTLEEEALVYFRCDSNDLTVKKVMISKGYYIAECSCLMKLARFKKIDFGKIYKNDLPLDTHYDEKDIEQLQEIARESFHYSRFHEDPFIDLEKAKRRYEHWILDLIDQGKELFLYRSGDEIISFLFYEVIDNKANLILGGSKDGYGMMTLYFFSTILTHFQKIGIKKVEVMISASNLGIANTYIKFGFTDQMTFFDYHKIFKKS
ncbi:GNAT family protein [Hydrogenimonas cancrithermarum]|uniref:N-acetyltransferase domain-containing protein n=1 Tax=Hydrogenimonas cancrithermarum TaxID=2993563 RepID=A0ABN6WZ91_9BACT|nr:GNAT family protein [Hydrogenimonas cancrithermarum]BDY13567.1 hypothetical protein HCR_18790 [Hydrogenimonas cancrithermarum]